MALLAINGADMPAPTTLHVSLEDQAFSSKRALDGAALVTRAAVKRRVEAYWAYLPETDLQTLLTAAAMGSALFTLSYPDPVTGDTRQMTAYSLNRSVGLMQMRGGAPVWTGVRIAFMEG